MALTVQNLRAVGTGVEPASLLPGQIAFNVTDKILFVGDGSNFKTNFDGTQTPGVPGEGWYAMPMDFASLGNYYVANPLYYGDTPTDQQVLTWSTALNHPIWTSGGGGGGGNQVYVITNADVAAASGSTTSDKITAAIGVASPDEGDVTIVTGLPDDVYEGLYFFTTEWVKGAAYAYPSASEVIYDNTVTGLTPTVQGAIDDLDAGLAATTAIANTANSTANSALSIANAALPKAGGTMTGTIVSRAINVQAGNNITFTGAGDISFAATGNGIINGISDSVISTSSTLAASANALRFTYDLANAALARSGGTMTGTITFSVGQIFPVSGIQDATAAQKGVVQIGTNIQVAAGVISVLSSTTSNKGVVQLNDTLTSSATDEALTARAGADLQSQIDAITLASNVTLAGSLNAATGLLDSVTTQGAGAGFVASSALPAAAAGNADYYVLVTIAGSYSPPGGGGPYTAEPGDWFLSSGTAWQYLGVGARPQSATYSTAGIVQLADTAVTYTGTSDTEAVTPNSLQDKITDSVTTTDSNLIASATAAKAAYDIGAAAIPCATITAVGDIVVGGAGATPTALPVGTDGQVLIANSTCATGLEWVTDTPGDVTSVTATSPVTVDNTDPQNPIVGIDAASTTQSGAVQLNDTVISTSTTEAATANATKTAYDKGVSACTIAQAAVPCSSFLAKGNILGGTAAGTYSALTVGTNGQVLLANSACATGLEWGNACYVPDACFTALGDLVVGTGIGTYSTLTSGTNGQVLLVDTTCATGLKWGTALLGYTCSASPQNTALGFGAGDSITTGLHNTAVGYNAGTAISAGDNNTFMGYLTGDGLTSGNNNTVVGACAFSNTGGSNNTAMGYCAGASITLGNSNTLVGANAGDAIAGGNSIVGIGQGVLGGIVTAAGTVAIGATAGAALTSAANTTLVGFAAGDSITTGARNTVMGHTSGGALTTGTDNTIIGALAANLTTGTSSTIVGACAGAALTLGGSNIFLGANAGDSVTTGFNNTIIGDVSGSTSLTGNLILAAGTTVKFQANNSGAWSYDGTNFGTAGQFLASQGSAATPVWCTLSLACVPCSAYTGQGVLLAGTGVSTFSALPVGSSGQFLTVDVTCAEGMKWVTAQGAFLCGFTCSSGNFSVALGFQAGGALTPTGFSNVFVGYNAGCQMSGGDYNVAVGNSSLQGTGSSNVAIGAGAMGQTASTGNNNVAIGYQSADALTSGANNIAIGQGSLGASTTASDQVAVGHQAGCTNTTGAQSVYVGSNAGLLSNSVGSTFIGFGAGCSNTNSGCTTYVGYVSGRNATGLSNTYVGALTGCAASNTSACGTLLGFCAGSALTTGNGNILVGFQAGRNVNSGANNVAIGTAAFQTATTAASNVAVGCGALAGLSTSAGNTALGHRAMINASTAANNVVIGCSAGEQISTGSTNVFIGNTAGDAVTTGSSNTIIGDVAGSAALTNNLILAAGTTIKLQVNENGAVGVGTTPDYGTAGQILASAGTGATAAWSSSLPQVTAPAASTDAGTQGQIASDATYFYMYTGGRWQRVAWDATAW
jgi:hypothetical protein